MITATDYNNLYDTYITEILVLLLLLMFVLWLCAHYATKLVINKTKWLCPRKSSWTEPTKFGYVPEK